MSEEQLWQLAVFNVDWPQSSEVKKTCNETDNGSLQRHKYIVEFELHLGINANRKTNQVVQLLH